MIKRMRLHVRRECVPMSAEEERQLATELARIFLLMFTERPSKAAADDREEEVA